jgi:hypothetical protein
MSETFFMLCWVSQSFFASVLRLFSACSKVACEKTRHRTCTDRGWWRRCAGVLESGVSSLMVAIRFDSPNILSPFVIDMMRIADSELP